MLYATASRSYSDAIALHDALAYTLADMAAPESPPGPLHDDLQPVALMNSTAHILDKPDKPDQMYIWDGEQTPADKLTWSPL